MTAINAMIISAMPEEMAPFQNQLNGYKFKDLKSPIGRFVCAHKGRSELLLITTGVGMTATAACLGWALSRFEPRAIFSVGSTGGLAADSRVGQVIIGSEYVNAGADGTAFGYAPGQVPGQPAAFPAGERLLRAAEEYVREAHTDQRVLRWASPNLQPTASPEHAKAPGNFNSASIRIGQMLSSDAFVTEANVDNRREVFPDALSADMESASAAQVAHAWGVPFISIRGISDLCGNPDDQSVSFHAELDDVATAAAITAAELLFRSEVLDVIRSTHGPGRRFNQVSLKSALYLMLAHSQGLAPRAADELPDYVLGELADYTAEFPEEVAQEIVGLVAAGFEFASENPQVSLTAKDYDSHRTELLKKRKDSDASGFQWPPTSQTIIKRFNGYWNDALSAIGLKPRRGRARGGLKFANRDYLYAVRSYLIYAEHAGQQASFNGYADWLNESGQKGRLPSGAAIRQRFGAWKEALTAAAGFEE